MTVDPDPGDVDPGISASELLHAGDLIEQCVVRHVSVVSLVKLFRTPRRAHAVDLDDDEPEFGERLRIAASDGEGAASNAARLRSRINVVDNRIPASGSQTCRAVHQPVQVADAVSPLDGYRLWRLPSRGEQLGDIRMFEFDDQLAFSITKDRDRWNVRL